MYGYLGPNGAGKTTTIRLLLGLHRPPAARAELFGVDCWRDPVEAHRRVAYVAGEPFLWPSLTAEETLEFLARLHGGTDVAYRDQLVDRFELETSKKVRALSKGNRQKVQLIAALATRADLLLLDEPTSGLDPLMEMAFRDVHRARPRSAGRRCFCPRTSSARSRRYATASGSSGPGRLVDEGTLDAAAAPQRADGRGHVRRPGARARRAARVSRATPAGPSRLRFEVSGSIGPLIAALAGHPVVIADQPRAVARGDLPAPLRPWRRSRRRLDSARAGAARDARTRSRAARCATRACARSRSRTCSPRSPTSSRSATATRIRRSPTGSRSRTRFGAQQGGRSCSTARPYDLLTVGGYSAWRVGGIAVAVRGGVRAARRRARDCGPRRTRAGRSSCSRDRRPAHRVPGGAGGDRRGDRAAVGGACSPASVAAGSPAGGSAYLALAAARPCPCSSASARSPASSRRPAGSRSSSGGAVVGAAVPAARDRRHGQRRRLAALGHAARLGRGAAAVHRRPAARCSLLPIAASVAARGRGRSDRARARHRQRRARCAATRPRRGSRCCPRRPRQALRDERASLLRVARRASACSRSILGVISNSISSAGISSSSIRRSRSSARARC